VALSADIDVNWLADDLHLEEDKGLNLFDAPDMGEGAFLQKALAIQPSERFTVLSALDDPWLKDMEQIPCQASEQQEDGDNVSSPARRSADLPRQLDSHGLGSYRLVIAIDYGTAFTSGQSLLVIFGVS
jgi:hypothetical protein